MVARPAAPSPVPSSNSSSLNFPNRNPPSSPPRTQPAASLFLKEVRRASNELAEPLAPRADRPAIPSHSSSSPDATPPARSQPAALIQTAADASPDEEYSTQP